MKSLPSQTSIIIIIAALIIVVAIITSPLLSTAAIYGTSEVYKGYTIKWRNGCTSCYTQSIMYYVQYYGNGKGDPRFSSIQETRNYIDTVLIPQNKPPGGVPLSTPTPAPVLYTISIKSNINAIAYINNNPVGTSNTDSWLTLTRPPADYTIRLSKYGYSDYTTTITLSKNIEITAQLNLPSTPTPTLPPIPNPPVPTYAPSTQPPTPIPPTTPAFTSLTFIAILIIVYVYRKSGDLS